MKKLTALTLSLALGATLAAPAMAGEYDVMPISAPVGYGSVITVNGTKLDTSAIPAAKEGYIPMRLVAEGDHGSAYWDEENGAGSFYMDSVNFTVSFADYSVVKGEDAIAGVTAQLIDGVTFLPTTVLEGLEGYTVTTGEDGSITITTPNSDPLIHLGYGIIDEMELGSRMKSDAKGFFENFSLDYEKNFENAVAFMGMNINADTLVIGKLAEGADVDAVKAALETYRKAQEDTFSWYLPQNLPKVQDARTVVNGDYVLFLIGEGADNGVELFNTFVSEQK